MSFETGNVALDSGTEVTQFAVHPGAFDHGFNPDAPLFVKSHIFDTQLFGFEQVVLAGVTPVKADLPRRASIDVDLSFNHGNGGCGIGRVSVFDDEINDQPGFARREIDLVAVFDLSASFNDDVGVFLEYTDDLLPGRHFFTVEHASLSLIHDTLGELEEMPGFFTPCLMLRRSHPILSIDSLQSRDEVGACVLGISEEPSIESGPFLLVAQALQIPGNPLDRAAMVSMRHDERLKQSLPFLQQTCHYPNPVPQKTAVAWLVDVAFHHRGVRPSHPASLHALFRRFPNQATMDLFPGFARNRADAGVECRFAGGPSIQPNKRLKGPGIIQMKSQIPIGKSRVLFQNRCPKYCLHRHPATTCRIHLGWPQIFENPIEKLRMPFQAITDGLQLPTNAMIGIEFENGRLRIGFEPQNSTSVFGLRCFVLMA